MNQASGFSISNQIIPSAIVKPSVDAGIVIGGIFTAQAFNSNGDLIWEAKAKNLMVDEGLTDILDVYFSDAAQTATAYLGLKTTGVPAAADTLAVPVNWTEITDYTGNRKEWVEAGVVAKAIGNAASPASFTFTGAVDIYGAFLCNCDSGTVCALVCVGDFDSHRVLGINDTLQLTYNIEIADNPA